MTIDIIARPACFIIEAAKGNRRIATKIIRKALRKFFTATQVKAAYVKRGEIAYNSEARFCIDVDASQFDAIMIEISRVSAHAGFRAPPVDAYHD